MTWYAFDVIQEAADNTRELLLPFEKGTWLRLAVLVIFTGSGLSAPNIPTGNLGDYQTGDSSETGFSTAELQKNPEINQILENNIGSSPTAAFSSTESAALIGIGLVIFALGIFFLLISSVFQFVYYRSLIDKDVRLRSNFRNHFKDGLRYMIFSMAIMLLMAIVIGGGILGFVVNPLIGVLGLLAAVMFLIPVAVLSGLVNNFVLPETITTDQSFWTSLKTGLGKVRTEWKQVSIYILTRFGLKMFIGMVFMLYALATLLVLLIPFGIFGAIAYILTPLLAVIPAVIGIIAWLLVLIAGQIVTQTYLNYFALGMFEKL